MTKEIVEDDLEANTLKTIEIININDIRIEKDNLELNLKDLAR